MLDISRHFIPLKLILGTIDAMDTARMNVLHLHLTDSQSFPIQLEDVTLPSGRVLALSALSKKGAFGETKVYSREDLRTIVQYAMNRGIEVIPEIDMPAHALSWGKAFEDVIVRCHRIARSQQTPHNIYPLDPSNPLTFELAEEILKQIVSIFPGKYLHIGGDEVNEQCWQESEQVQQWAKQNSINPYKITKFFEEQIFRIVLHKLKKIPIVWQGIIDANNIPENVFTENTANASNASNRGRMLRSLEEYDNMDGALLLLPSSETNSNMTKLIVEPWKCWGGLAVRAGISAMQSGYPVWMAACHYLDYNSDWTTFLMTDLLSRVPPPTVTAPQSSSGVLDATSASMTLSSQGNPSSPLQHEDYFLGGEGAMWTECVDHTNFECRVWPRAGAIAQALWGFKANDCESLSLDNCTIDKIGSENYVQSDTATLSLSFTKSLYAGYTHFRYYLSSVLQVSASQLIFHYPERSPVGSTSPSMAGTNRRQSTHSSYLSSSNIEPIFPRNLSRALQLIDALEAGIIVTSSGPRIVAALPPSATHRSGHQMWISSQCLGIPESIQRPLNSPGISIMQLNIADGSLGARRDQMLAWLQAKATEGVQMVGFCELSGWNALHSKTELVKNVPLLTLRAANAGFVHSFVSKPSSSNAYPVGLVSIFPFEVIHEWQSPHLQRGAVHVFVPKLQLHIIIAHLHAHDSTLRSKEARFLVEQLRELFEKNEKVVIMGDLNTLSPYDRMYVLLNSFEFVCSCYYIMKYFGLLDIMTKNKLLLCYKEKTIRLVPVIYTCVCKR